ncbi:MAG TPA: Re/Si-specific NAD(P)(+) transhydrogenase subunit alpha [Polyangia bacterium]|jgi:NAD(P) transhydrogenase subunit alpha
MKVGIPKEIYPHESRVAAVPDTVHKIKKLGFDVVVQAGAGDAASFADAVYVEAGATIAPDAAAVYAEADVVLKVRQPIATGDGKHEVDLLKEGATLISFIWPAQNKELLERMAARKVTVLAMDAVPRITRAQRMDALSAMANIAGYRAVIEAAAHFGRFFPGQVTAAGRVKPAQVFIVGAGVAGLAAIAAARALGAQVKAFDTRPAVREQVESLGGTFVEFKFEAETGEGAGGYAKEVSDAYLAAEQAMIAQHAKQSDIVISTALIPGKPAPQLITSGAVVAMTQGSVLVDMAAEQGGNCALTERDKVVEKFGVTIIGLTDLPSRMARQSSELYATTVFNLLKEVAPEGKVALKLEDEVQRGVLVLQDGALRWPPPKPPPPRAGGPTGKHKVLEPKATPHPAPVGGGAGKWLGLLAAVAFGAAAVFGPPSFTQHLTVFILACVVGWHLVWSVTPALHTPLMSVTNAISGIILIGGMLALFGGGQGALVLGGVAILVASINVAGGFLVTQRMLRMFRK